MTVTMPQANWGLHVEWLVDYLIRYGVSVDEIAAATGHRIDDFEHVYLPIDDYLEMFAWGAEQLSAPHLGLDIADELEARILGIIGYLISNSSNVAGFCETLESYQPVFMRGMEFDFRVSNGKLEIQWQIYRPLSEGVRLDVEFTLAAFLQILRAHSVASLHPIETRFSHGCTEPLSRYEETFGSTVIFDQEQNCLVFNDDVLDIPLSDSDPKLLEILKEQADSLLQQWEAKEKIVEQVKFQITTSLEGGNAGAEMVAQKLNITARTLNRHLQQEGTNYQQLREEVIADLAKQSLAESDASITAIGGKLGYSESSAFVRAFKRMAGTTPVAYRNMIRQR